jgi:hypothetical protein
VMGYSVDDSKNMRRRIYWPAVHQLILREILHHGVGLGPIHTMRHVSIPSQWSVFTLSTVFSHLPEQHMLNPSCYCG